MATKQPYFRHHEGDVWKQLGEQLRGKCEKTRGDHFDKVVIHHDPWTVTLDIHHDPGYHADTLYTRFRAPYINADGFHFTLHHAGLFSEIVRVFSQETMVVGDSELDDMFIIQSNKPDQMKRMVSNPKLRQLLKSEPHIHMTVRNSGDWFAGEFPEGVDELVLEVPDRVENLERLKKLYDLFSEALHTLCRIGSAYEDDPAVHLDA